MRKLIVDHRAEGQRLNKYLGHYLDAAPQSFIYKMLRKKNIKYNGAKADGSEILSPGDYIEIYMAEETIAKFRNNKNEDEISRNSFAGNDAAAKLKKNIAADNVGSSPLDGTGIIYEDSDIIILNKPVGMLSQKARPEDYSLNERIVDYYNGRDDRDTIFTPSVCNRLDRNTSGIILAGMSYKGTRILSQMLKERTIRKYYLTIVKGNVKHCATIKGFLAKKETHNQVVIYQTREQAMENGIEHPAYIETAYTPIKHGTVDDGKRRYEVTLLKVELITGKTHQIRAHLRSVGHPILGDGKYGHKDVNAYMRKEFGLKNQLLHAYEIVFPENVDKLSEELSGKTFKAELPAEFRNVSEALF